jgi:RNA polymerase sigma factor (sigma-70 family)
MRSLGLNRLRGVDDHGRVQGPPELADVHCELQGICVELIHDLAEKGATLKDVTKAAGYFRNAFRNKLEDRLTALIGSRKDALWGARSTDILVHEVTGSVRVELAGDVLAPEESGLTLEDRVLLQQHVIDRGDKLSPQEKKVFLLTYRDGLKGSARAEALGTTSSTARVHLRNALKKLRPPT